MASQSIVTLPDFLGPDKPWLAPLAGFSDLPFRLLCREYGAAAACTEMVSAKGMVYDSPGTEHLLATCEADTPLVVQLFGFDPVFVGRAMEILLKRGFGWFDLNAGCAVKKVVKTGAGAALLKDAQSRKRLLELVKTMTGLAGPGRVGVKTRLGWFSSDNVAVDACGELEQAGVGWLTLHPRFAVQGFSGTADWDALRDFASAMNVPVLASGDLFSARDGVDCLRAAGVQGVMFARGALADPAVFRKYVRLLKGDTPQPDPPPTALMHMIRRHVALAREYGDDVASLRKMRTFIPRYVRSHPGVRKLRNRICKCTSWENLDTLLIRFLEELEEQPSSPDTQQTTP